MRRPLLLALSIVCVHRIGIHTKWEIAAAATAAAVKSSQSELPFLQGSWTIDSSTITYFTFTHNHSQINPFLNFSMPVLFFFFLSQHVKPRPHVGTSWSPYINPYIPNKRNLPAIFVNLAPCTTSLPRDTLPLLSVPERPSARLVLDFGPTPFFSSSRPPSRTPRILYPLSSGPGLPSQFSRLCQSTCLSHPFRPSRYWRSKGTNTL